MQPYKYSFRRYFDRFLKLANYNTVLDCASAGTKFTSIIGGEFYTGVDISQELIENAKRKTQNAKRKTQISFVLM